MKESEKVMIEMEIPEDVDGQNYYQINIGGKYVGAVFVYNDGTVHMDLHQKDEKLKIHLNVFSEVEVEGKTKVTSTKRNPDKKYRVTSFRKQ